LPDPRDVPVSKLLHKIVSALIDQPEFLTVKTSATEDGATFTIGAHPDHTGKLIGKQGRNAKSIGCVAVAADGHNSLAMLVRRQGETLAQLLIRLDQAIAKALDYGVFTDEVNPPR
jgi:predicted RNA-binding protein YlqC (UPF0109 family)